MEKSRKGRVGVEVWRERLRCTSGEWRGISCWSIWITESDFHFRVLESGTFMKESWQVLNVAYDECPLRATLEFHCHGE